LPEDVVGSDVQCPSCHTTFTVGRNSTGPSCGPEAIPLEKSSSPALPPAGKGTRKRIPDGLFAFLALIGLLVLVSGGWLLYTLIKNRHKNHIVGVWQTTGDTTYEFKRDGTVLIVGFSSFRGRWEEIRREGEYQIDGDEVSIKLTRERRTN